MSVQGCEIGICLSKGVRWGTCRPNGREMNKGGCLHAGRGRGGRVGRRGVSAMEDECVGGSAEGCV